MTLTRSQTFWTTNSWYNCMPLLNSKMAELKRESLVDVGCNVIQSRHQNKCGYFSMQKRSATFMFYPSSYISVYPALEKIILSNHCVVLIEWSHKKTPDTNNSGLPFSDLSNMADVFLTSLLVLFLHKNSVSWSKFTNLSFFGHKHCSSVGTKKEKKSLKVLKRSS